jgi:hypothetical protein
VARGDGRWRTVGAIAVVWGMALATQWVAARLGYHPHLGAWIYRAPPWADRWLRWGSIGAAAIAGLVLLLAARRRWAALPLALAGLSMTALRGGPVYSPTRVFIWYAAYHRVGAYRPLFGVAWFVLGGTTLALVIAVERLALRTERKVSAGGARRSGVAAASPRRALGRRGGAELAPDPRSPSAARHASAATGR